MPRKPVRSRPRVAPAPALCDNCSRDDAAHAEVFGLVICGRCRPLLASGRLTLDDVYRSRELRRAGGAADE